jgi:integrase
MLQVADSRDKAIISLFACTGIRIGAVPDLKLSHLQKINKYNLYRITIYENTKQEYFVFTTPEFCSILETYLFQRVRRGEKITFNEEKGTWSPANTPLFRRDYNKGDPGCRTHIR